MTFEEWRDRKGFPVTSTQEPLWRECWDAAQRDTSLAIRLHLMQLDMLRLRDDLPYTTAGVRAALNEWERELRSIELTLRGLS